MTSGSKWKVCSLCFVDSMCILEFDSTHFWINTFWLYFWKYQWNQIQERDTGRLNSRTGRIKESESFKALTRGYSVGKIMEPKEIEKSNLGSYTRLELFFLHFYYIPRFFSYETHFLFPRALSNYVCLYYLRYASRVRRDYPFYKCERILVSSDDKLKEKMVKKIIYTSVYVGQSVERGGLLGWSFGAYEIKINYFGAFEKNSLR